MSESGRGLISWLNGACERRAGVCKLVQLSCSGADDGPVQQTDRSGFEGGAAHTQRSALIAEESFQMLQARASEVEDPSTRFSAATQRKAADGAVSAIKSSQEEEDRKR